MRKRQSNCTERVKKVRGTERGADFQIQGSTDKQKSFCSLSLTKKPTMFFWYTLIYQRRFKCQIIKDLFHNTPLRSKLKNFCCPSTNIMRMNRAICIPRVSKNLLENIPVLRKNLLKALTRDCNALISEWADLQKR